MPLYLGSDLISDVYIGIAAGGIATTAISITANGSYTPPSGTYYSGINVNVPIGSTINNQNKTVTPTTSTQTIQAASGYTGLGTVTINPIPSEFIVPSGTTQITANGSYDISHYATATVNVASGSTINNQNITITPSESTTVVSATSGYTGLGTVTVNGISTTYIGSQVPQKSFSDLNISGNTVTVPFGYYDTTATASLTISTATNSIITGQAYLEATNDYGWRTTISLPAGYYNALSLTATYSSFFPAPSAPATDNKILLGYEVYDKDGKKITGSMANNSYSATLNQSTTSVTIPAGYHDGTGTVNHVTVTVPNPTISVSSTNGVITASGTWTRGFTTNASYTATAIPYTTLGATTYNATSNNITIAAGRYLTGTQTIRGVTTSGIAAGDIRSGVVVQVGDSASAGRIVNVTGSLVVNKYYTGSSAPSSSLGNNGDIYLQT